MASPEKYGHQYKEARKQKMESTPVPADEITYKTKDLETHHNVPKMFDGPDIKENLIILCKDFHAYIHHICNVKDSELVYKRKHYAKKIVQNPLSIEVPHSKKKLSEIDEVLMKEYINNMIMNVSERYRDKVLELTLYSQMTTIREQKIEITQLKEELLRYKNQ